MTVWRRRIRWARSGSPSAAESAARRPVSTWHTRTRITIGVRRCFQIKKHWRWDELRDGSRTPTASFLKSMSCSARRSYDDRAHAAHRAAARRLFPRRGDRGDRGVIVFVAVLSIAEGFQAALAGAGSPDTAIVMRGGSDTELSSGLPLTSTRVIKDAPGVQRAAGGPVASTSGPRSGGARTPGRSSASSRPTAPSPSPRSGATPASCSPRTAAATRSSRSTHGSNRPTPSTSSRTP